MSASMVIFPVLFCPSSLFSNISMLDCFQAHSCVFFHPVSTLTSLVLSFGLMVLSTLYMLNVFQCYISPFQTSFLNFKLIWSHFRLNIYTWMSNWYISNFTCLKLYSQTSPQSLLYSPFTISVDGISSLPGAQAKDLGVILDSSLSPTSTCNLTGTLLSSIYKI